MAIRNFNVAINLVSIEGKLIRPTKRKTGIGNDWTVDASFLGWIPKEELNREGAVVSAKNNLFPFKTKGTKKATKTLNKKYGAVLFADQDVDGILNIHFRATLTENDPKFIDNGDVNSVIAIPFKKTDKIARTVKGIVNAKGGDEPGAIEFTFNIEITVSSPRFGIGTVVSEEGLESNPTVERGSEEGITILSSKPVPPGVNMGYMDPATRVQINQILNTIDEAYNLARNQVLNVTKFVETNRFLRTGLNPIPGFSDTALKLIIKRIENVLERSELPEFDTGTKDKTIKVDNALDPLQDDLFGDANSIKGMVIKKALDIFLPLLKSLYKSFGGVIASMRLLAKLKPAQISGATPVLTQTHPVQIQISEGALNEVSSVVNVRAAIDLNEARSAINPPATLNDVIKLKMEEKTLKREKAGTASSLFPVPASRVLNGSYDLLGNYGVATIGTSLRKVGGIDGASDKFSIAYFGAFEHELREW